MSQRDSDSSYSELPVAALLEAAWAARSHARATFSGFRVGTALLAAGGAIYTGCNIEASNYSLTICAERAALVKAISEGAREFRAIVVAAESDAPTPPCGSCRQLLWEFCGDIPVIASNRPGEFGQSWPLSELLPSPFGSQFFQP